MKTIDDNFVMQNTRLFRHKKCVFIVGAGISVASGIPDFRSPNGIFSLLRQQLRIDGRQLFSYNFGIREGTREIYLKYIADLKKLCDSSQPNMVHHFLATYPSSRIYTQNIDGLEERAGMVFTKTDSTRGVYLHGNLKILQCRYCGYKESFGDDAIEEFSKGVDRSCSLCTERREKCIKNNIRKRPIGVMHPGIIHYQQAHPDGAFIGRLTEKDEDCDLLIVIGTSLKVEGIKKMVKMFAKCSGVVGKRILVNLTRPTKDWEEVFDYFYEGDCSNFVSVLGKSAVTKQNDKKGIVKRTVDFKEEEEIIQQSDKSNSAEKATSLNVKVDLKMVQVNDKLLDCKGHALGSTLLLEQKVSTAKISLGLKRTSLSGNNCEKKCDSFLSEEKYDESLLKEKVSTEKGPLLEKLEALADTFDKEEALGQPVLDNVVKLALPTSILQPETCSATEYIQGIPDSSCADLEEEFNKTFSDTLVPETTALDKALNVASTPKRKTRRKASKR